MPFVQIILLKGRTLELKKKLVKAVSNAVAKSLEIPLEQVHVALLEVDDTDWASAGITIQEKKERKKERRQKVEKSK